MVLNATEDENDDQDTIMILQREELMVPPPTDNLAAPTIKNSHFLKPFLNPTNTNQPHPKPHSASLSSDPKPIKDLTKLINFKGRKVPNDSWKTWVDNLIPTHHIIWKKSGIFDAIRASTYVVKRDDELIIKLAHYWCPETNTFIFPWGECTITLEDVMILGGFSVLGESVVNLPQSGNFDEIHGNLVNSCLEIKRKNNYHVPFYDWIKYFKGKGGELEHVGLLVQWLSRYVFCVDQFDIDVNSFPFAISLAQGRKIALAPAVLASIYRDLTLLKTKIVACNGEHDDGAKSKLVLWSPMQLVQVWAWERFPTLSPKPKCLVHGEPRVARWDNVQKLKSDRVSLVMESGVGTFLWRPYAMNLENWEFPKFYSDEGLWVIINEELDEELLSFARCLRASELVGLDCVEQYLPHRVGMQFGMDQDIPDFVPRLNDDLKLAWSSYDKPLDSLKLYLPPRLHKGDVTVQYSKLWRRMSPLRDDACLVTEMKKKRKRGSSSLEVKKPSTTTGGEPPNYSSQTLNETIVLDFCGSHKEVSMDKSAPLESMPSRLEDFVNEILSLRVMNPSTQVEDTRSSEHNAMEVNEVNGCHMIKDDGSKHFESHISQIDSSTLVNEAPSTKDPLQGPNTEKLCSVLAEDDLMKYRAPFNSLHMECWRQD